MSTLDDIDNTPLETPTSPDAEKFLTHVERLIDEDHVQYARDFLEDVSESVRKSGNVSVAQWRAVQNIDEGGQRGSRYKGRRGNW